MITVAGKVKIDNEAQEMFATESFLLAFCFSENRDSRNASGGLGH